MEECVQIEVWQAVTRAVPAGAGRKHERLLFGDARSTFSTSVKNRNMKVRAAIGFAYHVDRY